MAQQPPDGEARPPRGRRRWHRRTFWIFLFGCVLAGGVWLGAPAAIRVALESWLTHRGSTGVSVGRVDLGLWPPRIALEDVRTTAAEGAQMSFGRLAASLEIAPLLDRRILLRELVLDGIALSLVRGGDGRWRIGGLSLGGMPQSSGERGWDFGVRDLDLRRARIALRAFGIDDTFTVDRLRLANMVSWEQSNPLTLEADLGKGAATLGAKGSARPFATDREGRIEIEAAAVPLDALAPLARPLGIGRLAGQARLKATLTATDRGTGMDVSVSGALGLTGALVGAGGLSVGLDRLDWNGAAEFALGGGRAFGGKVEGTLSLVRAEGRMDGARFEAAGLETKAAWQIKRAAGATAIDATSRGEITAKQLRAGDGKSGSFAATSARWNGRTDLFIDPGRTLYGFLDGALTLGAPTGEGDGFTASAESAGWRGWLTASRAGEQNQLGVMMRGAIDARSLAVRATTPGLTGQARSAGWEGYVEIEGWDGAPELHGTIDGRITLRDAALDDKVKGLRLAAAQRAAADGLLVGLHGTVLARDLDAERLRLLAPLQDGNAAPVIAARNLFIDRLGVNGEGLSVEAIRLDDATLSIVHDGDGRIAGLEKFRSPSDGQPRPAGGSDPGGGNILSRLAVAGPLQLGGESRLVVTDRSLSPPFTAELAPLSLSIGRISAAEPASDTAIALDATLRPHSKLALKGTIRPLAPRPTMDLHADIRSLDLAPLSPYAEPWLGYAVKTGQMNAQADARIDQGRIQGNSSIGLFRLTLDPLESGGEALAEALPVSLDTALDLLRDDRNRIRVDIPISGDIADPQFDLSEVVNRAVGRAIGDTLRTTLMVIFPIGALAAAVIDDRPDGELRFTPLLFPPGSAALDSAGVAYLDQLAELLTRRSRIRVSLCGAATEADRRALAAPDARLLELAGTRAEVARGYLVTQRGIESRRLPNCRPTIDKTEDAQPRLDVVL